ncbi:MAG: nucleoside triphosphate pyrophosphohydrolase, partial [Gemmatimonadota bacterium]
VSSPPPTTPAKVAATRPFPPVEGTLDRALALVEYLREHCPWDRKQTAHSLVPHLLEETAETVDAIHGGDGEALRGELGDLLLNLAFQVVVAEEEHRFDRTGVVEALERKMIGRHPHLFGLGEEEPWEVLKARERRASGDDGEPTGVLEDLASGLDPLLRAHRMQERVAGVGFDWDDASGALAKVREELGEVEEALAGGDRTRVEEEVGDLLFSVVNLARLAETHAVPALAGANGKFRRRFEALESLARERNVLMPGASLEELDRLWDEVKKREG